jgi:hypothetical protein
MKVSGTRWVRGSLEMMIRASLIGPRQSLGTPRVRSIIDIFDMRYRPRPQHTHHGLKTGPLCIPERSAGLAPVSAGAVAGFQRLATCAQRFAQRGRHSFAVYTQLHC